MNENFVHYLQTPQFVFTQLVPIRWRVLQNFTEEFFVLRKSVTLISGKGIDYVENIIRVSDEDSKEICQSTIRLKIVDDKRTIISTTAINYELKNYFRKLLEDWDFLCENKIEPPRSFTDMNEDDKEPWRQSRPDKRERDRIIWEAKNENYPWERIAELADCGKTTAIEVYRELKNRIPPG